MAKKDNDNTDDGKESKTITFEKLLAAHKQNLARKILAGETNLAKELEHLQAMEHRGKKSSAPADIAESEHETGEEIGIPERLRIKRAYTLTPVAREQRRSAGKKSSEKAPNKNWRHGLYARSTITAMKQCKSTCAKYPCELIAENKVSPGEACLDMVFVVQTYSAIMKAVKNKEYEDYNEMAAMNIARAIDVLRMCLEDIMRDGTIIKSEKINTEGKVIGFEIKPHPSLLVVPKMLAELGMTPQEAMITPRQIAKQGADDDDRENAATLMGSFMKMTERMRQGEKDNTV